MVALLTGTFSLQGQDVNPPIHVSVTGSGNPVLFLPGFACPGAVWDESIAALSETYECHVVTYAGFGQTEPIGFPWLPEIREALLEYLEGNGLGRAKIVGHSMGGTLALWLSLSERIDPEALLVVDGLPAMGALMIPDYDSRQMRYENPWNKQMLEMDASNFEAMARNMAAGMTRDTLRQGQLAQWMQLADRETYVYGYTDLLQLDLRDSLARVPAPVRILAATRPFGEETARATYSEQYRQLGNFTLDFAPESAHFIMFDQPDWFVRKLEEFLR